METHDKIDIVGFVNTAICYAKTVEEEAINRIKRMCDYELTRGRKICAHCSQGRFSFAGIQSS